MKDLRSEISGTARALDRIPNRNGGRAVMVIGPGDGVGTSSIAASLGMLLAARSPRATWLVDLNLIENQLYHAFQNKLFPRFGLPGRALDASLNSPQFYSVAPQLRSVDGQTQKPVKLLGAHRIENTNLFVTRFRHEYVRPGQKVQIRSGGDYWVALRRVCDWAVVDAPAITSSSAGLAVCRYLDGVILAVRADETEASHINMLRDEVESHGGNVLGIVVNDVKADARLADRLSL